MGAAPPRALQADERAVWVLRGERATSEVVKIGITDGTSTEVVSGELRPGERAVSEAVASATAKRGP